MIRAILDQEVLMKFEDVLFLEHFETSVTTFFFFCFNLEILSNSQGVHVQRYL